MDEQDDQQEPRKAGRKPIGSESMTSTERNRRRLERLAATAVATEQGANLLMSLHRDLVGAKLYDWADRIAAVCQFIALKAVAEYTRRNAKFFVRNGPSLLSPDANLQHQQHIKALAAKIDVLASETTTRDVTYDEFDAVRMDLQRAGFCPEQSLTSAVAQAFYALHKAA